MNKENVNRRNFLRIGALATAGATISAKACNTSRLAKSSTDTKKVITRPLGKTGIELPIISMGTSGTQNINLIKAAYTVGVRYFDTAMAYSQGKNEEMIGEFLNSGIDRSSVFIATKTNTWEKGNGTPANAILTNLDNSLKRLRTDYVDVYNIHSANSGKHILMKDALKGFEKAKASGKARLLGVATHINMTEVINTAIDTGVFDVVTVAYNFIMADDKKLQEAIIRANEEGLGVIAMKALAGIYFQGQMNGGEEPVVVEPKAALKWVASNPYVHTSIPGTNSFEALKENFSVAYDTTLNKKEGKSLQLAMAGTGTFCKGCLQCVGQCPHNLPIPDLMRSYMYNYSYKYPAKAYETVAALHVPDSPCADCSECLVKCASNFDIKQKITQIARIKDVPQDFLV